MYGFKVAAVAGIEYSIAKGFVFGFEMHPLAYRYDLIPPVTTISKYLKCL